MTSHHRTNGSSRGMTLIEVIVAVTVLGMVVVLAVGGAQPYTQKQANIARCANNLRLLAAAAHCYADDFKGKFFYDWGLGTGIWHDGSRRKDRLGRWWDPARAGRYLQGQLLPQWALNGVPRVADAGDRKSHLGLGGGIFKCPEDLGAARSYHLNFWASGIEPPRKYLDIEGFNLGQFFDRNGPFSISRLILFGEMIGLAPTGDHRWVTVGEFGRSFHPGERFGGLKTGEPMILEGDMSYRREPSGKYPTQIDYIRHGANTDIHVAEGAVNFAYGDAHVELRHGSDLVEMKSKKSTLDTLWSPIDQGIEGMPPTK